MLIFDMRYCWWYWEEMSGGKKVTKANAGRRKGRSGHGPARQDHKNRVLLEGSDRVVDVAVAAYGKARQHCIRTIGRQRRVRDAAIQHATACDEYCHYLPLATACNTATLQHCKTATQDRLNSVQGWPCHNTCYNHIRLWCDGLHHQQEASTTPVNQRAGVPSLDSLHTACPAWVVGGHRVVNPACPPFCASLPWEPWSVARVEDQDRLAGVWRRLWCAEEADVRCRIARG